jgi:hypothetical protein
MVDEKIRSQPMVDFLNEHLDKNLNPLMRVRILKQVWVSLGMEDATVLFFLEKFPYQETYAREPSVGPISVKAIRLALKAHNYDWPQED